MQFVASTRSFLAHTLVRRTNHSTVTEVRQLEFGSTCAE